MKKIILGICILIIGISSADAQKYFTRNGKISFFSEAAMEKIEANNSNVTSVIDVESGKMEFAALIKAFHFEKSLMQEHFNENYMESSKYPKAIFKGKIQNLEKINFTENGTYDAEVKGALTIHGVTKNISTKAQFIVKNSQISGTASFVVLVADYGIEIPKVVKDNIAKEVKIDVTCDYQIFK